MKALQAEGVPVGVWQRFILPAMTVFRAKNAYGRGCPWSCQGTGDGVEYDPAKFPVAQKHCDTHFGMTTPLRAPHGPEVAQAVAEGFQKVFSAIESIDADRILAAR
jgi:perosamine synthetase